MIWPPDDRIRRAFAETAKRYDDLARRRFRRIATEMIAAAGVNRKDRILDVACGSGLVARVLSERGLPKPVGLDISMDLLRLAPPGPLVCADAMGIPARSQRFDVVLCSLGIQMFEDPDVALREMHRVLVDGGRIGLTSWSASGVLDLDRAAVDALDEFLQGRPGYDPSRWRVPQTFIGTEQEMIEALRDNGFTAPEIRARRKRSAFRDSHHYLDMLSIFPAVWARLNSLAEPDLIEARDVTAAAIEREVGHSGPFEILDEVLISTARR